jgi:hypothetical protein
MEEEKTWMETVLVILEDIGEFIEECAHPIAFVLIANIFNTN